MRTFVAISTFFVVLVSSCTPAAVPSKDAGDAGSDAGTTDASK